VQALRDELEADVLAAVPETIVNGDPLRRVPNTSNISFDGIEAESLLIALDLEGIAVSTGSACSSGSLEPSHVLRAMGLSDARTRNAIRFSLGLSTTEDDVAVLVAVLPGIVTKLRRLGRTAAALR
jgi:cysteine desulfurase